MKKRHFISLFFILLLLSGCAGEAAVSGTLPQPENRLVVYTSHKEEVYQPIIREFEERTADQFDAVRRRLSGHGRLLRRSDWFERSVGADYDSVENGVASVGVVPKH